MDFLQQTTRDMQAVQSASYAAADATNPAKRHLAAIVAWHQKNADAALPEELLALLTVARSVA